MSRALVVGIAMMVIAMSCFVDRRSGEFECETEADCTGLTGNRTCDDGFCVLATCPAICDGGCGPGKTCTINCSTPNECRNGISCPVGYTCEFNCVADCTPVTCPLGCTVACSATADCGPVSCGTGATCTCSGLGNCL